MLLFDGSSLLHRILHTSQGELQTSDGKYPTGGIHGFLISLGKVTKEFNQRHGVVVAWDLGSSAKRRALYPDYKEGHGDRDPKARMPDLAPEEEAKKREYNARYYFARKWLHSEILPRTGCVSILIREIEADDIIAYIARHSGEHFNVIISSDHDFHQLPLNCKCDWYDPKYDNKYYDRERIIKEYRLIEGMELDHFLTTKAMVGDGSDNIPSVGEMSGVKGLGPVTCNKIAGKLLRKEALDPSNLKEKAVISRMAELARNYQLVDLYHLGDDVEDVIVQYLKKAVELDMSDREAEVYPMMDRFELRVAKEQIPYIAETCFMNNPHSQIRSIL